jgi:hypothetical protein
MRRFLYRALREAEIQAGGVLIPKKTELFIAHPRLPITLPFRLGLYHEHAVREHQWDGLYETCGISTTPHLARAQLYAARLGVIVKIDLTILESVGIVHFRVADFVAPSEIAVPEDDEVILVSPTNYFSREIIVDELIFPPTTQALNPSPKNYL